MAEPADIIVPLLREMRGEMREQFGQVNSRLDVVDRRLKKLEEAQVSYRQALTADSLPSKLVTGDFEERIEALESTLRDPQPQK